MISLLAGFLFALGAAQLLAVVLIYLRHAIPRSPKFFQYGSVVFGTLMAFSVLTLSVMLFAGWDALFGMPLLVVATIWVFLEFVVWVVLDLYGLYWIKKTTRRQRSRYRRQPFDNDGGDQ